MLSIREPKLNGMTNPIGISETRIRFSWFLESNLQNVKQTAYRVIVYEADCFDNATERVYYDSGKVYSENTACKCGRPVFISGKRLYWKAKSWDNQGEETEWSELQYFETGLLHVEDWKASWIEPKQREYEKITPDTIGDSLATPATHYEIPEAEFDVCPLIRKTLTIDKEIRRARLYVTAHGVYKTYINGHRVGNLELMPENTCYHKLLQVQTYDVTDCLTLGENVIGTLLGDGWWRGHVSCFENRGYYGSKLGLLLQLNIEYIDGTTTFIGTDGSEKAYSGTLVYSDIGMGEKIDQRRNVPGWSLPGKPEGVWETVKVADYGYANLVGQNAEPIKILKTFTPIRCKILEDGSQFVDFGQVIAGNCRIVFDDGNIRGQEILISYCEQPDKDENFIYNFSGYHQHEDLFILAGEREEIYEPYFAVRGFRWIRIKGYSGKAKLENITGRLISSDLSKIAVLETSNEYINRLNSCIQWALINNLASVPTDNPDRERDGWTGDFSNVASTMFYNYDLSSFIRRWLKEARLEQHENGCMTKVVPMDRPVDDGSSAGWGDCAIIAPWEAYQAYGDIDILSENYLMMQKWMDYVVQRMSVEPDPNQEKGDIFVGGWNMDMEGWYKNWSPEMSEEHRENFQYLWDADFSFGDWMVPSGNIDKNGNWQYFSKDVCETFTPMYFSAYSSDLLSRIAHILGKEEDAIYYRTLNQKIKKAVLEEVYNTGVIPNSKFQGVLTLALKAGLYPEGKREELEKRLIEVIYQLDGGKINTGFSSLEHIMFELVKSGNPVTAYDLLFYEKIPSYKYMIEHGATAIWETWRNISEDGTVNVASYTQYAMGTIGKWLMAGIGAIAPLEPGYKKIKIEPVIDPKRRLESATASYKCPHGEITTRWVVNGCTVQLFIHVPVNTTAEVMFYGSNKENAVIGSGDYSFTYKLN